MKQKKTLPALFAAFVPIASALLASALVACAGIPGGAWGNLGRPSDPVPFMEDAREGVLSSGLSYTILENAMPADRALIRLVVGSGSLVETDSEQGLAHFVEHMAFQGTDLFPGTEIVDYLRSLGMRFGPDVNAFTSFDRTVYMIEVPIETRADGVRAIPEMALAVIDQWSRGINFNPDTFETERLVVIDEYRMRLGAWDRIRQGWLPSLLGGSRFAERMPIGQLAVLETATREDLIGYYDRWYRADNMSLIFVGDFDGAALEASLAGHFHIQAPPAPTPRPTFDLQPPRRGSLDTLVLTDAELPSSHALLYFARPQAPRRGDIASFRVGLIDSLISEMVSLRFAEAALDPASPFSSAWGYIDRWGPSSSFYVLEGSVRDGQFEGTIEELLRAQESIRRHGFHATEIALARDTLLSNMRRRAMEANTQQSQSFMNALTDIFVVGGAAPSIAWQLRAVEALLPGITDRDINNAARDYFALNDVQAFVFAPEAERAGIPGDARIAQMIQARASLATAAPQARIVADRLLATTPQPGAIVSRSVDARTGAHVWLLENGATVILYETENRNDEIVMQALARGGWTSAAADGQTISARLAANMTDFSGIGPWSLPDLQRQMSARQVTFNRIVNAYTRGFNGSTTTADAQAAFEMLHLAFTDTRMDPSAIESLMASYRSILANRDDNPRNVFSDEVDRMLSGDDPRFDPFALAHLDLANADAALDFLRRGLNPADFTFVFVGNLTPQFMEYYVATYLASIPRLPESLNQWANLGIRRPGPQTREIFRGIEDQSVVFMSWHAPGPNAFTEREQMVASVLAEYLNVLLFQEIRDNIGGTYSIWAGASYSVVPVGEYMLQVQFTAEPARVAELIAATQATLARAAAGIGASALADAIQAGLQTWEVSMQNNNFIAGNFVNSAVMLDDTLDRLLRRPEHISSVTAADLQRLLSLLLRNGPATAILYPETRATAQLTE